MSDRLQWFLLRAGVGILLIIAITSCVTEKRRKAICQTCTLESKRTDSTVTAVRERTVPVTVPGPTVYVAVKNPCAELCDSLGRLKDGVKINVPGTTAGTRSATIFTRGDSLHVLTEADSLRLKIAVQDSLIKRLVTIENTTAARCELDHITKWDSFFIISGRVSWLLLVLIAIWLFIRKRLRILAGFT